MKFVFKNIGFCDIIQYMKNKIMILSSLLSLHGMTALASECIGAGCYIEPATRIAATTPDVMVAQESQTFNVIETPAVPSVAQYAQPVEMVYAEQIPMRQVKLLSIKPIPEDTRPALWDGTHGNVPTRGYDKTVDWRDGVPIWDDSISSYKDKDFSDWFLQPTPELYIRDADTPVMYGNGAIPTPMPDAAQQSDPQVDFAIDLYNQNMNDAAATRQRIEEILAPKMPSGDIWVQNNFNGAMPISNLPAPRAEYTAQDLTETITATFGLPDGCPFETETECNIWLRKPIVRESVSPRSPKIRDDKITEFIRAAKCDHHIDASHPTAAPLVARYKMLMNAANACCTDGFVYSLKRAGASDGLVYKFMADDANFYGFGARCLMMTDAELDAKYPNTATAVVAADVRNGCLCRGRQWFQAMLAPFTEIYRQMPEFRDAKLNYTYTDGLQREITVSINNDVQNVLQQLSVCP